MPPFAPVTLDASPAVDSRDPARLVSIIQQGWREGRRPDAVAALAAHPHLAADRPLVLELAYEEYCLREEAGERIDPHAFADRFPYRTSLLRLIGIHSLLQQPDAHPRRTARLDAGDTIGDYQIVRPLGRGGFADVYLAHELSTGDRGVVLKLSTRNAHEAGTLGPLAHPHLMPVLSAPVVDGERVVVMPFFGVSTLDRLIGESPTSRPRCGADVLRLASRTEPGDPPVTPSAAFGIRPTDSFAVCVRAIAGGVADALAFLHERGLCHRDVKPENVLIGPTGRPFLLDFNLAAAADGCQRIGGTLPYLAPEVLSALTREDADPTIRWDAADVFSFGVVLWELMASAHPYFGKMPPTGSVGTFRQAEAVAARQRTFLRRRPRPQFGGSFGRLVSRCLAVDPAERPSAAELARSLRRPPRRRSLWMSAVIVGSAALSIAGNIATPRAPTSAAVSPAVPTDPYSRGVYFHDRGQWDLAASAFSEAGQLSNDGHAYTCAAYCLARARAPRPALAYVQLARATGTDDLPLSLISAYCGLLQGDAQTTEAECQRVLAQDPNCQPALLTRSLSRYQQFVMNQTPVSRDLLADFERATVGRNLPGDIWLKEAKMCVAVEQRTEDDLRRAIAAVRRARHSGVSRVEADTRSLRSALQDDADYQAALNVSGPQTIVPGDHPHLICPIR